MSFSRHKIMLLSMLFIVFEWLEFGNGNLLDNFLIVVTTTVHVPSAIGAWWNDIAITSHTCPKTHGIQEIGSRTSTFIASFRVVYEWHTKTFVKILTVHHGMQRKLTKHLTTFNSKSFTKLKLLVHLKILTSQHVIYFQQFGKQYVPIIL